MMHSGKRSVLNEKLKAVCNSNHYEKDFILGINVLLKSDDDILEMLDYLAADDLTTDDVSIKALEIYHGRPLRN